MLILLMKPELYLMEQISRMQLSVHLSTTFGFTEGMTLTSVQLNRVSAVDVRSKNITSLKEIEYFKNLQMYIMAVIYIIKF